MNTFICCRLIGHYNNPIHDYCNFILYALTTLLYFHLLYFPLLYLPLLYLPLLYLPLLYLPLLYLPLLYVSLYAIAICLFNCIRMRQYMAPIKISAANQLTG